MIGDEMGGSGGTAGGLADLMSGGGDGGGSVEAVAVAARDVAPSPASALDVMRYQSIQPELLPVPNGGGSDGSRQQPAPTSSMVVDVPVVASDSSRLGSYIPTAPLEPKPRARALRPLLPAPVPAPASAPAFSPPVVAATQSPARDYGHHSADFTDNTSAYPNGDGASPDAVKVLQWGHNKGTRGRGRGRGRGRCNSQVPRQPVLKMRRRWSAPAEKLMPPPGTRNPNLRITSSPPPHPAAAENASLPHQRSAAVEERAGGQQKQQAAAAAAVVATTTPPKLWGTAARKAAEAASGTPEPKKQKRGAHLKVRKGAAAGSPSSSKQPPPPPPPPRPGLPRIVTTLTRKEKEEDFMAMTGTKLPQRPRKRSKQAEKAVSYICPGAWLSEVTRNKYVVRERKSRKEKQRRSGLKAMEEESRESD